MLAAVALSAPAALAQDYKLPSIGEPADRALSPREEREIGEQIYAQLLDRGFILEDAPLSHYITTMGRRLATASGANPDAFTFFIIKDDSINAFALPGGYIGIHTGLMMTSRTESELAGVMAHEIAHVTQRHIARQMQGSGAGWTLATAALVAAAIAAGAADPQVIQAALGIGLGQLQQQQINHTRAHELEADRVGIRALSAGNYDPEGMATFFERLQQTTRLYGSQVPEILRTHPVNTTRISEARSRLSALPASTHTDSTEYALMKARARVFSANPPSRAGDYFKASADAYPDDSASNYGLALVELFAGDGDGAQGHLKSALAASPDSDVIKLAAAEAATVAGDGQTAIAKYEDLLKDNPDNAAASLSFADSLIKLGQPARARATVLESSALSRQQPEAYRLLALAARDDGREVEAHYQMAAYFRYRGNYRAALLQLGAGLARDDLSDSERARLQTREIEYRRDAPPEQLRPRRG